MRLFMLSLCLIVLFISCEGFEGESACENTCPDPQTVSFVNRCHCDRQCAHLYNDCCYDSPYRLEKPSDKIPEWQCRFVPGENRYFFMIGQCQDGWDGDPEVTDKCEKEYVLSSEMDDSEGEIPITSRITAITYKNRYCAICNNDEDDVTSWKSKGNCRDNQMIIQALRANQRFNKQWDCIRLPFDVSVRECVPGLISSCPSSWRDMTIKRKCESYVNPVFWSSEESYRNIYCALCNNRTSDDYWCEFDSSVRPNTLDCMVIVCCGKSEYYDSDKKSCQSCGKNKIYDHVTNSCRNVISLGSKSKKHVK